ncbi:hypothetical protein HAX54_036632 [Datura stramonium]|uniref:Uncharacterized protein n=1 Tax=Datura stramonium TaxID=4076 RepID=A0ABS8SGJ6_DATST|nr:hypothetical protein [Datura stramonium]
MAETGNENGHISGGTTALFNLHSTQGRAGHSKYNEQRGLENRTQGYNRNFEHKDKSRISVHNAIGEDWSSQYDQGATQSHSQSHAHQGSSAQAYQQMQGLTSMSESSGMRT